jgi:hypothetical protein
MPQTGGQIQMTQATKRRININLRLIAAFLTVIALAALYAVFPKLAEVGTAAAVQGSRPVSAKPGYTADGALIRPEGYREWVYVGTPLTPNTLNPPEAPFPDFHNVYIHPSDYDHWQKTGAFRDGTVIIKELVAVGSTKASSGKGYFMGEYIGLEALVKDSRRFKDEPGYWAFFSFGHKYPLAETTEKRPVAECNACHQANGADDYVFTRYYPVLRAARPIANSPKK